MDHDEHMDEIVSLNADDLQVEELERRLEMALAAPIEIDSHGLRAIDDAGCTNFNCGTNTITLVRVKGLAVSSFRPLGPLEVPFDDIVV